MCLSKSPNFIAACDLNLQKILGNVLETKAGRKFLSDILITIYFTHRVLSSIYHCSCPGIMLLASHLQCVEIVSEDSPVPEISCRIQSWPLKSKNYCIGWGLKFQKQVNDCNTQNNQSQLSTRSFRQMLCGSFIKI